MDRRTPLSYPDHAWHFFLWRACDLWPERCAIDFEGHSYSFREIEGIVNALARGLRDLGITPGQRVALLCGTRPEWIFSALAVSTVGASLVTPSPSWKERELRHALQLSCPNAVITEPEHLEVLKLAGWDGMTLRTDDALTGEFESIWTLIGQNSGQREPEVPLHLSTAEAFIPFSSGTTGLPKAVRHSQKSVVAFMVQWCSASRMTQHDRLHLFLPLSHVYGMNMAGCSLLAGAQLSLFRRFNLENMLTHIEKEKVTIAAASAPIAVAMANMADVERFDLSSLRYMIWAATPVAETVARRVTARTGVRWLCAYGLTEANTLTCGRVQDFPDDDLSTVGYGLSDMELGVIDPDTTKPLPLGSQGELVVKGPNVMLGYLPEEENHSAFTEDGWLRTGDIGFIGADGRVRLVDRAKEMLKVSGFAVAPAEIENVLHEHPAVADCAVYGIPDDLRGESPTAVIVATPGSGVSGPELQAWVFSRLAHYKQLGQVRFVDQIPRSASGKVLRRLLRDQDAGIDTPPRASVELNS
jgi:long-chain acyl-CoA synthetase